MVKALHRAGIEVILDVVYNHTAEGNHLGPMLAFKGIDNASYYRLMPDDPRYYMDFTGHGQLAQPGAPERPAADHGLAALLRRRVPRRRLPLRPRLGARARVLRRRPALGLLRHHPPGPGALPGEADRRAVGRRARAATRSATSRSSGRSGTASTATRCATSGAARRRSRDFAQRFTGSSDLYAARTAAGRSPRSTSSPRTTASRSRDLVSYNEKHNEANGEGNRDGTDDNRSWNCGVEGPTDDPEVNALRGRQQRNFLATLLLSQGVPMLLGGDELGRTQRRQQQRLVPGQRDLLVRLGARRRRRAARVHARLIALRSRHPVFRRDAFLDRRQPRGSGLPDVWWFRPDGRKMTRRDWAAARRSTLGVFLNGDEIPTRRRRAASTVTRRLVPAALQRPPRADRVPAAAAALRAALDARAVDGRAAAAAERRVVARGELSTSTCARSWSCAGRR